ncbi:MAG: hypothetical protein ACP5QA_11335 [Phycisphaerae bacterium]
MTKQTFTHTTTLHLGLMALLAMIPLVATTPAASAGIWQFSVKTNVPHGRAYLWIPPHCKFVRGIIFGQQVILEKPFMQDSNIRAAAAAENLAEVLICPAIVNFLDKPDYKLQVAGLYKVLARLAKKSGYTELAKAPLLPVGHSGGGILPWRLAYYNRHRTIAIVTLHAAPSLPAFWNLNATADGVPVLADSGQYESWTSPMNSLQWHLSWVRGLLLYFRGFWGRALVSEIVEPGAGHFSLTPTLTRYIGEFIRQAARERLPNHVAAGQWPVLRHIPLNSGWLGDVQLLKPAIFAPASYSQYRGQPQLAFWFLNKKIAMDGENFEADRCGKRDQRVTFVQDGKPLPAGWLEPLKFHPIGDGMTVKVHATFLKAKPIGGSNPGKPLGHGPEPIQFRLIGGWNGGGRQVGPNEFRIHFSNFGLHSWRNGSLMIMAYAPGDKTWAYAEQAGSITFPNILAAGKKQTITFARLADVAAGTQSIPLTATSSSGLPVAYYITSGPAYIRKNRIIFTPIPPRAKYPVAVRVTAYQWGRTLAPQVASAPPITQTFYINR